MAAQELPEWQQYPAFAELLSDHEKYLDLRKRCLRTCEQLDQLLRTGNAEQRVAAQESLNAYGLAIKLLDEALAARDQYLKAHAG